MLMTSRCTGGPLRLGPLCRLLSDLRALFRLICLREDWWSSPANRLIFTNKRINPANFSVLLGDTIFPVSSVRFLGFLLDPHLTGHLHAKQVINKCSKLTNIIKFLRGVWWGSDPRTLLGIYRALIGGTSDYVSFLFPFHNKSHTERFERVPQGLEILYWL